MEFEDHLVAGEAIVRQLERREMRLTAAIEAFRTACEHVKEGERVLDEARLEVFRLAGDADGAVTTEPLELD